MRLSYFLLLLAIPSSVAAQSIGYDVLGVAMYCKRFLAAPQLPAMSTLMSTFGDPLPCVKKRADAGNLKVVQVDLIDATCWRNGVCPPGTVKPTDLNEIKKRAAKVREVARAYPAIEFWVSPALEHDVKNESQVRAMLEAARAGCPECKVINSPFTGAKPKGYPVELHGTKVRAFAVSGDGASSFDADNIKSDGNGFEHRIAGEHSTFLWWNELNLRCTGEKKFTPPLKRTEKPSADQFKQAHAIAQPEQPKPAAPKGCATVTELTKPEIHKPNAESYCNGVPGDARGNKPLLIIKRKGQPGEKMDVVSPDGQTVGCFKYYGPFADVPGTFRWYMGDCSGQTPAKLMEALGGEWGFVKTGGGKCVLINSVRRTGVYR